MRHFYAHLGNINATTIIETNKWSMVIGMMHFQSEITVYAKDNLTSLLP